MTDRSIVPGGPGIDGRIFTIRGHRVMLDADLAALYGVTTGRLNEQVKRNRGRFPADFAFQLTAGEVEDLRSQFAISSLGGHGGRRYLPRVFTEHGAVMLASVLNSPTAINASIEVVRAFVRMREMLVGNGGLAKRLDDLEKKYDGQFRMVFTAIRALMAGGTADPPRERIGFKTLKGR